MGAIVSSDNLELKGEECYFQGNCSALKEGQFLRIFVQAKPRKVKIAKIVELDEMIRDYDLRELFLNKFLEANPPEDYIGKYNLTHIMRIE